MSKSNTWFPLFIGDYMADTRHLSTLEHGAYLLLLMCHWKVGSVPDDDRLLARMAGLRLDHWRKIAPTVRAFFEPDGSGGLVQKRMLAELHKAQDISGKRAEAAKSRGKNQPSYGDTVDTTDTQVKALKSQQVAATNAAGLQSVCTTQSQSQLQRQLDDGDGATRVPAREAAPAGKPATVVHLTPALKIVDGFVASRRAHWPDAMDFPRQEDRFAAERWLTLGAERGVAMAEMVQISIAAVTETHDRLVARGHAAPERLGYHDRDIARAVKARTAPGPDLASAPPPPQPGRAGPHTAPNRRQDPNQWAREQIFGTAPTDDDRSFIEGIAQ